MVWLDILIEVEVGDFYFHLRCISSYCKVKILSSSAF